MLDLFLREHLMHKFFHKLNKLSLFDIDFGIKLQINPLMSHKEHFLDISNIDIKQFLKNPFSRNSFILLIIKQVIISLWYLSRFMIRFMIRLGRLFDFGRCDEWFKVFPLFIIHLCLFYQFLNVKEGLDQVLLDWWVLNWLLEFKG